MNTDINLSSLILLIFSIINFPLALLIFRQNKKSWTNKLFSLLIVSLTVYLVVNTELYIFKDHSTRLFFGRFIIANGALLNLLVFLFLSVFPGSEFTVNRKVLIPILVVTFALFVAGFTDLIFKDININSDNVVTPVPGLLLPFFGIHTLGLIVWGIVAITLKRKKASGIDRTRVNYVFFAFGILFFLILTFNFIFPVIFNYGAFVPFLPIYILIFLGIVSFSILKHSLFGLRILATQILTLILWVILLSNLFASQSSEQIIINGFILFASIVSGILLIRSVTREVEQRQRLQELNDKLKALDKQKDEFLSMAAHELRAPMTAIKGYVSMVLEGDTGEIPEKARNFLAETGSITDRLVRLVNNMLDVSRIEEGRIIYQMEVENLSNPLRTVYSQFVPEAERKELKYDLKIPKSIKDKVYVDPDRIQEVVGNLISNAVKYTDKGFVEVRMLQPNPDMVRVEIADSGTGISKAEQTKLFQKFYRVESNVGKTTGTGLGLYISRLIVEKFNGTIGVDSDEGKGSTFWFEIPLHLGDVSTS